MGERGRMNAREVELAALIAEQEADARLGEYVPGFALSLDAPITGDASATFGDLLTEVSGADGDGYLKSRREHATKPIWALVGYRARARARKRMYGGICEKCGAVTDGSYGRAKAPKRCAKCAKIRAEATCGTVQRYRQGCRCQPCRWENARYAWDVRERRKARAATTHPDPRP